MFDIRERLRALLAGDPRKLVAWMDELGWHWPATCGAAIVLGCGCYGVTLGLWRDPLQSFFTAVKFPLLIFLTCAGNAVLNGCLAQVLGSGLGFRQTTMAILMSFTVAAADPGRVCADHAFSLWNTPPLGDRSITGHSITLLAHVAVIAFAGIAGNHRLFRLLRHHTENARTA